MYISTASVEIIFYVGRNFDYNIRTCIGTDWIILFICDLDDADDSVLGLLYPNGSPDDLLILMACCFIRFFFVAEIFFFFFNRLNRLRTFGKSFLFLFFFSSP